MGEFERFSAPVPGGELGGWITGEGVPVLLLHGGPGMGYAYLDQLAAEIGAGFRVAAYQQRGLAPSTQEGPFTIPQAIDDALAVLATLAWTQAVIVGHSWGGHLALRIAAGHPGQIRAALAVDPLGVVDDGGMAAFEAEMLARTPREDRERARLLDKRAMRGEGTPEEALESLRIMWPAYFADPAHAAPMPCLPISIDAYSGIIAEVSTGLEEVAAGLAGGPATYGVIAGGASPMPWGQAARATAELSPRAFLTVVPAAGHFPWLEVPGCVRAALRRLV